MLRKFNWRIFFTLFIWVSCLTGLVFLMSFINVKKQEVKVSAVKILIPGANNFIEREEIDAILKSGFGELVGRNIEQVNIHEIEERIKENPYIAFAKVYSEMDGVIRIKVRQKQPVLRVINAGQQDFYIDEDGFKMPVSANFTANVLVATGNITEPFSGKIEATSSKVLRDLYRTALFVKQDTLWDAQFEQIFVNEQSEIELIPRVGIQKIVLGDAEQLELKMKNLLIFYKKAMPVVGWETYKTINLKYSNQVICEKNKIDSTQKHTPLAVVPDSVQLVKQAEKELVNDAMKDLVKEMNKAPEPAVNAGKADEKTKQPAATTKAAVANAKGTNKEKTLPDKGKQVKSQQNN